MQITPTKRISAFLLSMLSPVLQKSVCGGFRESAARRVELADVEPASFQRVLDLWCGRESVVFESVRQLMRTTALAERFQVAEVKAVLEDALLDQLSVGNCAEALTESRELGLGRVEAAAERFVIARFEEVAGTEGFLRLGAAEVGRLLDADELDAMCEERVLECVVRWMEARERAEGGMEGAEARGLLGKVRFQHMQEAYLASEVARSVPPEHREWAKAAVAEALAVKLAAAEGRELPELDCLEPRAASARVMTRPPFFSTKPRFH